MRETLYLRLRSASPDALTSYCIAQADSALSWTVSEARLEDVLARVQTRRLVVLVPGADVRLTHVTVPARSAAKVLQAAPYALEEQLAEDVDTLHFALGPRQTDGAHPVAVVSKARMDQWLAPLQAQGLKPDALIAETLCLPDSESARWNALAEDDAITVRSASYSGFSCAPEDLPLFLSAANIPSDTTLRIIVPRSNTSHDFTRLAQPVELLPGFNSPLEALLQNLKLERNINLLQGAYSQGEDLKRLWQPWRAAAMLAAVWLILAGVNHAVQAYRIGKEARAQDDRNVQRFQQLFPAEQRIVDLSAQVDQQMTLLRGSGQRGGFLPLLEALGPALAAAQGLKLQSLQFREGALYVSLGGSDLQQLESLRGWFAQNRAALMEVQSANSGAEGVQIRLKLTPA